MINTTQYWLFGNDSAPLVASYSPKPCQCDFYETVALILLSIILLAIIIAKIYCRKKTLNLDDVYKTYAELMQTDGKLPTIREEQV